MDLFNRKRIKILEEVIEAQRCQLQRIEKQLTITSRDPTKRIPQYNTKFPIETAVIKILDHLGLYLTYQHTKSSIKLHKIGDSNEY